MLTGTADAQTSGRVFGQGRGWPCTKPEGRWRPIGTKSSATCGGRRRTDAFVQDWPGDAPARRLLASSPDAGDFPPGEPRGAAPASCKAKAQFGEHLVERLKGHAAGSKSPKRAWSEYNTRYASSTPAILLICRCWRCFPSTSGARRGCITAGIVVGCAAHGVTGASIKQCHKSAPIARERLPSAHGRAGRVLWSARLGGLGPATSS